MELKFSISYFLFCSKKGKLLREVKWHVAELVEHKKQGYRFQCNGRAHLGSTYAKTEP